MLQLTKPLAFIDLETTGINLGTDRIVEIAIVKILTDGTRSVKRKLINPEMPIPAASSDVHGITDDMVKDAPTFKQLAQEFKQMLDGCDLAGYNSNRFDIPILAEEFLRSGIEFSVEGRNLIDVQVLFHMMEQRTLKAAVKFYCGRSLDDAHEALPDALATAEVFGAMLERYQDVETVDEKGNVYKPIQNDMAVIHATCERQRKVDLAGHLVYNQQGEPVFNFGKYKNVPVEEVFQRDAGYFGWLMNADFPLYTKKVLRDLREDYSGQPRN